eukprot:6850247-Pyramimonas_sp.AAC.1
MQLDCRQGRPVTLPNRQTACRNQFEPNASTDLCLPHRPGGARGGNVARYGRCHVPSCYR